MGHDATYVLGVCFIFDRGVVIVNGKVGATENKDTDIYFSIREMTQKQRDHLTARTWAEVDLDAIADNVRQTRLRIGSRVKLMAVVKANAYGHGAFPVSSAALSAGADILGVATIDEALALRNQGVQAPIMVIGYTPSEEAGIAAEKGIILTIVSPEHANAISQVMACNEVPKLAVHLKIDTGMGRLGAASLSELDDMVDVLSQKNIEIEGAFTHFAQSDALDKEHANRQLRMASVYFTHLRERTTGRDWTFHAANSAAIIDLPQSYFSMVRLGIAMYGVYPSGDVTTQNLPIHQSMSLFTRVSQVKDVQPGVTLSYGSTFVASKPMTIATLPIGYADGLHRMLSNRGYVSLNQHQCPILGRICMDQTLIDVTAVPTVSVHDVVTVYDEKSLPVLARYAETIPYELLCAVSQRIPRIYK